MPKIIENAKDKILENARKIVEEQGYDVLTVRKLAECSNVSIGTIYNYFPNKNVLDYELFHFYWKELLNKVQYNDERTLYDQLNLIYQQLQSIIHMFTGVFTEFYKESKESSKEHRNMMFIELSHKISHLLNQSKHQYGFIMDLDSLSQWISLNMVMMSHMHMDYSVFDKIIKKIVTEDVNE